MEGGPPRDRVVGSTAGSPCVSTPSGDRHGVSDAVGVGAADRAVRRREGSGGMCALLAWATARWGYRVGEGTG